VNGLSLAAALGEEEGGGVRAQAVAAREAQRALAALSGPERSAVLRAVAAALLASTAEVGAGACFFLFLFFCLD
jgi:acyl-CoA reductase-like NAD-dependent aldehyde dehydrogenase